LRVIGTAGHVDHGKSALVSALTGINPDRLKEEQRREMTIDLGFAWLTLPSGQKASIVDVPGHEDFIKNMLAGVGGIDLALLVVAADESVMPQTREHLAILDLLRVRSGVVAVTKIDLVDDDEWLALVEAEIADLLADTCLVDAPIVRVSARTGEGLDTLLKVLDEALGDTRPRPDLGRPRLPIDRVFTVAGFGTVVTGTLSDGTLRVGDEVEIQPHALRSRVRGLQTHKESIQTAVPGSRVAVNLVGVAVDQLKRGDVLTYPGVLRSSYLIDTQLRMLPDAPGPLRHNVSVDFFSGAAEIPARVRLLGARQVPPGGQGWAQLQLSHPTALLRGDRFILRRLSPGLTIGGGVVLDPVPRRKWRRFRPEVRAHFEVLSQGSPGDVVLSFLQQGEPETVSDLLAQVPLPTDEAWAALHALIEQSEVLYLSEEGVDSARYVISSQGLDRWRSRFLAQLRAYHGQFPLRAGVSREELKSRLRLGSKAFHYLLERLAAEGSVVADESVVRVPEHAVQFSPEQRADIRRLMARFGEQPYTPPSFTECMAAVGADVLGALLAEGRLVRVSEDVILSAEAYGEMVDWVVDEIKRGGQVTAAQVRDHFGTSRKYVIALLEHLDDQKITRRVGDGRVLR
jgi:selenocysteine-specific elongation factor